MPAAPPAAPTLGDPANLNGDLNDRFAQAMAALGPFEARPTVGVAVSGGSDSLALCLLAQRWAAAQGGAVVAFTVDHRRRPGSADEVIRVRDWATSRGIAHVGLAWSEPAPGHEAAREARYNLLEAAGAARGILHLLVGHTMDDQAETLLLRLSKGSGVDGLAGMAPARSLAALRILRPLLGCRRDELRAFLTAEGQDWLEDPSNDDRRAARGRLRAVTGALAAEGMTVEALAATARRAGRARAALDQATAALAGRAVSLFPEGYALIARPPIAEAPAELAFRLLSRLLTMIGGNVHPPRADGTDALLRTLRLGPLGGSRTLAGCLLVPKPGDRLLLSREPAAATECLAVGQAGPVWWDRRFRVALPRDLAIEPGMMIRRIGGVAGSTGRRPSLPAAVVRSLPALWIGERMAAVPYFVTRQHWPGQGNVAALHAEFAPPDPAFGPAFDPASDPAFAVV